MAGRLVGVMVEVGWMGDERPRVTFRVDRELKDQLDADDNLNTSGLMRTLLQSYIRTGDAVEVGLERRLKDTENELERLQMEKARIEHDIEKLQRKIDQIETKIEQRRQQTPEEVIEFAERLKNGQFSADQLTPDNPAVSNWAQKAGIRPEAFVRAVEDRIEGDR